ncbi:MAG TPA: hypothetical protein VKB80_00090 [Kofleriaceae bacterium]|nr:hypothetical protein [Kofleriaceae bacterium]
MSAAISVHIIRLPLSSILCATLLATAACAPDDTPSSGRAEIGGKTDPADDEVDVDAGQPGSSFIDAMSYFETSEDIDAWYGLMTALRSDFDDVCGDTFCEGDFSNLQSLRIRCSVEQASGAMGGCVWIFGASNEEIAPASGDISVDGQIFTCPLPIEPGTDVHAFVQALSAPDVRPIDAPLPGSGASLYDGLADCL